MPRVSRKQLEQSADMLNRQLERFGSMARVKVESRYDYHALDLTTALDLERNTGAAVKALALGSTGELNRYLHGMHEALWLLEPPYGKGV